MNKAHRELVAYLERRSPAWTVTGCEVQKSGKLAITVQAGRRVLTCWAANTPSDYRSHKNVERKLRTKEKRYHDG